MKKKMMVSVVTLILIATLVAIAQVHVYRVRDNSDEELLYSNDEAYLFIGVSSRGYRLNGLQYLFSLVKDQVGGVTLPEDNHSSIVVLRLVPNQVQRYTVDDISLDFYAPFENRIYANRHGELWRWAENHFELVNTDERQRLEHAGMTLDTSFTNVGGWSKQQSLTHRRIGESEFPMTVGGTPLTLVVNVGYKASEASIGLRRPGQSDERLWYLDEKTRSISKSEYEKLFRKH
jgi:hypothetical protein